MNGSLIKCNIIWFFLVFVVGFTVLATVKPDITKEWLTKNTSGFVDLFNLKNKPKVIEETYIKRNRQYEEPSAFEQNK